MRPKTEAELLALLRSLLPPQWFDELRAGSGGEILAAIAAVGERASLAAQRAFDGMTAGTACVAETDPALGPGHATGSVRLTRPAPPAGAPPAPAGTLAAGSILWSINGERIVTRADAAWAEGSLASVDVAVVSWSRSHQANLPPGTSLRVKIAMGRDALGNPVPVPLWDKTIEGEILGPGLAGGQPPALEEHAATKGRGRQFGESAPHLRARLRTLPDVVTPAAVRRAAVAEVPAAVLVEGFELTPFADEDGPGDGFFTDGSMDPTAPDAAHRASDAASDQGIFIIRVPAHVDAEDDEWFLYADYGHATPAEGVTDPDACWDCCAAGYLPARMPDGTEYDMGDPGIPPEIARMCSRVEAARPAGTRWWVEEY